MRLTVLFVVASTSFIASRAHAESAFPDEIVSHLAITCSNPKWDGQGCMVCHVTNAGGCTTATHPFGAWLGAHDLNCSTLSTMRLDELLDEAKSENVDTNCDGVPDVEELTTCQWEALATVNTCGGDAGNAAPLENVIYGCSMSRTTTPSAPVSAAIGVALFLCAITRTGSRCRSARSGNRRS